MPIPGIDIYMSVGGEANHSLEGPDRRIRWSLSQLRNWSLTGHCFCSAWLQLENAFLLCSGTWWCSHYCTNLHYWLALENKFNIGLNYLLTEVWFWAVLLYWFQSIWISIFLPNIFLMVLEYPCNVFSNHICIISDFSFWQSYPFTCLSTGITNQGSCSPNLKICRNNCYSYTQYHL